MLEGFKRDKKRVDIRYPISAQQLALLVSNLHLFFTDDYETLLFTSAILLAFYGLLKVSEYAVRGNATHSVIQYGDIQLIQNHNIKVLIMRSKMDQLAEGITLVIGSSYKSTPSLFGTLAIYIHHWPKYPGPFFIHQSGLPLTASQFTGVLKKVVAISHLSNYHITTHSLRIGMATHCKQVLGMNDQEIMEKDRWTSTSYKSYIKLNID